MYRAERGGILVFWAMSLSVLMGMIALSFDLGRVAIVQTELQSFADSVALAAAGELDGRDDAIERATRAADALISDRQTFGEGDRTLAGSADFTLTFHSALPASDTTAMAFQTTDPLTAVFVRVRANDTTVQLTFGAALAALTDTPLADPRPGASAVAGFTQFACDITPLLFCMPDPTFRAEENVGIMVRLRSGGNGAAWGPGNFGFIDSSSALVDPAGPCGGLSGVQRDACLTGAIGSITQCFSQRGVDTQPGQRNGIENAIFNVRFDIYTSIMNGRRQNPIYAPAPNVIKGIVPGGGGGGGGPQCLGGNVEISPDTAAVPRDTCFTNGNCDRFGNGEWSAGRANYVAINYDGIDPHPAAVTRFEYYQAEIAAAGGGGANTRILEAPRSETGRPMCSNQQSADPDRRVIIAAAIDCNAREIRGAETGVPVEEFVRIFLTEPVGQDGSSPPQVDIWGEIIGSAGGDSGGAGENGIFRDVVQLYR